MHRRSDPYVDEIAVLRCARGELGHQSLTWEELEQVIRRLEPTMADVAIGDRIGASGSFVATVRSRRQLPRRAAAVVPGIGRQEAERILGYAPRKAAS